MFQGLALVLALLAGAQSPPPPAAATYRLAAIELSGARRYTVADLARWSGLTVGRQLTPADLKTAADRLAASGLFSDLRYKFTTTGDRLSVTFEFQEAPSIIPVVFDNFIWFTDEEMTAAVREQLPFFDGTLPETEGAPGLIIRPLQSMLDARGIKGTVDLSVRADLAAKKQQYLFTVTSPAPAVCDVAIEGASPEVRAELLDAARPLIGTEYSRTYVGAMSKGTLTDIYRRRGYWRASIVHPAATQDTSGCAGARLALRVTEGAVYYWDPQTWSGNTAISSPALDKLLDLRPGDVAGSLTLDAGLREVKKAYGRLGYVMATTAVAPALNDETKRAAARITVDEGPQFRMGTLEFVNLPERDAENLRKRWKLAAGDVYDDDYPSAFVVNEIIRRRPGAKAPLAELRADRSTRVVNVRITFKQ